MRVISYDYGNIDAPIKICFIAGVHGNEPAGCYMLKELIDNNYFKNIVEKNPKLFIRVIPIANNFGFNMNMRYQNNIFYPDINRNFIGNGLEATSQKIIQLTNNMQYIVDFHEGWGFHQINSMSLGSTLTITPSMNSLGQLIINNINSTIPDKIKHFVILDRICDIMEGFGCYNIKRGKNYILVETSGQNDVQPLELRKQQIGIIISTVISYLTK